MAQGSARARGIPEKAAHRLAILGALAALALGLMGPLSSTVGAALKTGRPVRSVFHISKSQNRNQVHYGVKVDSECRPRGSRPVYGYWRDLEEGPRVTSPLLDHEQAAYGLTRPRFVERDEAGGTIGIGLRGFPDRSITIETFRAVNGRCLGHAITKIKKTKAVLRSIYVELGFLFSVDYVIVRGLSLPSGTPVQEKVND